MKANHNAHGNAVSEFVQVHKFVNPAHTLNYRTEFAMCWPNACVEVGSITSSGNRSCRQSHTGAGGSRKVRAGSRSPPRGSQRSCNCGIHQCQRHCRTWWRRKAEKAAAEADSGGWERGRGVCVGSYRQMQQAEKNRDVLRCYRPEAAHRHRGKAPRTETTEASHCVARRRDGFKSGRGASEKRLDTDEEFARRVAPPRPSVAPTTEMRTLCFLDVTAVALPFPPLEPRPLFPAGPPCHSHPSRISILFCFGSLVSLRPKVTCRRTNMTLKPRCRNSRFPFP